MGFGRIVIFTVLLVLSHQVMRISKELIRKHEKQKLYTVNAEECAAALERMPREEYAKALRNFLFRKAKAKL
jgi:Delta3-Delta2-enoyl-CoA isomerase